MYHWPSRLAWNDSNIVRRRLRSLGRAAGVLALWSGVAFGQAQVGESFGIALDPAQKSARQFHGGFYGLARSDALNARSFFDQRVEPLSYRDFRFALTGPLLPARRLRGNNQSWFFSWGMGWNQEARPETRTGRVPTAAERSGDFRGSALCTDAFRAHFADCRVPREAWSGFGPQLLAPYPLPNAEAGPFNLVRPATRSSGALQHSLQLDYTPRGRWKAGLRLAHDRLAQQFPFQGSPLGNAPVERRRSNDAATLRVAVAPTPKSVNSFSIATTRFIQSDRSVGAFLSRHASGYHAPELFPENPSALLPAVSITGFTGYSSGRGPEVGRAAITLRNDFSRKFGKHELKLGVMWMRGGRQQETFSLPAGAITFSPAGAISSGNALADVLLGRFTSYQEGRAVLMTLAHDQLEIALADKWKLWPRLTVEYEIAYFLMRAERSTRGPLANFLPWRFDPAQARPVPPDGMLADVPDDPWNGMVWEGAGASRGLYRTPRRDFAPRAGLSWQPFKKRKLSLRASGAVTFDRPRLDPAMGNGSSMETVTRLAGLLEDPPSAMKAPSRPPSLIAIHPDFPNPTVYTGNARLEQELGTHTVAAGYRFSLGRHLLRQRNLNQLAPGTLLASDGVHPDAVRPFPGYGTILWREAGANSSFHALEISASARKPTAGFTYSLRYAFSKTLTDSTGEGESPQDHFNLRNERATAALNRRHALVLQYSFQPAFGKRLPGGVRWLLRDWEITGVSTFSTGRPFDITQPGDRARMGGGVQRPDVTASPQLARHERTLQRYFNTEVFRSPSPGLLGNAARYLVSGPGTNNFNISVTRTLALSRSCKGHFRAEFLNAFNHPSFSGLGTAFDPATHGLPSSTFGRVTAAGPGRSVHLNFKVTF